MSPRRESARAESRDDKKREQTAPEVPLQLAAVGLEAEFELWLDGERVKPEEIFGSPREIIRGELMHRHGTSYHLPTGGAVYFDTGVIEVATPVIEIERGCAARAGRSLWEGILFVRQRARRLGAQQRREARLVGFSTHYNVSFDAPTVEAARRRAAERRTVEQLALLLTHILPAPVMLLATNRRVDRRRRAPARRSHRGHGGFHAQLVADDRHRDADRGDRARGDDVAELRARRAAGTRHSRSSAASSRAATRRARAGWRASTAIRATRSPAGPTTRFGKWMRRTGAIAERRRARCRYAASPRTSRKHFGSHSPRVRPVHAPADRLGDHGTLAVAARPARSPAGYEDVGRLCTWDNLFSERQLARSRYERVLIRAISGRKLWLRGSAYTPVAMRGWSQVVFRREPDGGRQVMSIDQLLTHLDDWERTSERQARSRQRL